MPGVEAWRPGGDDPTFADQERMARARWQLLEMVGDKAVFKIGKSVVEVPATLGKSDRMYPYTALVTENSKIVEIDFGGTTARLNITAEMSTTTIESKSNFFRASPPGRLTAVSVPLHVGRRTVVVQTSIFGADGKLAALVTQTQLVIPRTPKE